MHSKPDHHTLQAAADWFARLSSEPHDPLLLDNWQHWLAQHDSHRQAWRYVERVSQRFAPLHADTETAERTLLSLKHTTQSRRQVLRTLSVIGGSLALGGLAWRHDAITQQVLAWRAQYRTGTGEIREHRLADGSRIWLNSTTALDIDLSPGLRSLRLYQGEVLISTGNDPRPFVVTTAQGSLTPLGTRFSVREQASRTLLNVYEGSVQARCKHTHQFQIAHAGERLSFDQQAISAREPAQPERQVWTDGILLAEGMSLQQFIDELGDYRRGHLGVDPAVAQLRVMGTFPLHDGDRALAMLEGALPIRVEHTFPGWTTVKAR
jgi:transmembrane sensor